MRRALAEYRLHGLAHNLDFCRWVMEHPAFAAGRYDTGFIAAHFHPGALEEGLATDEILAAEAAGLLERLAHEETGTAAEPARESAWRWQHRRPS
jgi:propionyl-CoA carboxylase alpha chain